MRNQVDRVLKVLAKLYTDECLGFEGEEMVKGTSERYVKEDVLNELVISAFTILESLETKRCLPPYAIDQFKIQLLEKLEALKHRARKVNTI